MSREILKNARKAKKMTQQMMADYLLITLRHYQNLEDGSSIGSVSVWDAMEDLFEIHQRKLRELSNNYPARASSP